MFIVWIHIICLLGGIKGSVLKGNLLFIKYINLTNLLIKSSYHNLIERVEDWKWVGSKKCPGDMLQWSQGFCLP